MLDLEKKWLQEYVLSNGGNPYDPTDGGTKALPYAKPLDEMVPTYDEFFDYDSIIPKPKNQQFIAAYGGVSETIPLMVSIVSESVNALKPLANKLFSSSKKQSAYNVWHFIKINIKYKPDTFGKEQLRYPERIWSERHLGVDCDDYAIFAATLLSAMGYSPKFKLVKFWDAIKQQPKSSYGHVYVQLDEYAIDPVMHLFDREPTSRVKEYDKLIGFSGMNGISGCGCGCGGKGNCGKGLNGIENIAVAYGRDIFRPQVFDANKSILSGKKFTALYGLEAIRPITPVTRRLMICQSNLCRDYAKRKKQKTAQDIRKARYAIMLNGSPVQRDFISIENLIEDISPMGILIPRKNIKLKDVGCCLFLKKIQKSIDAFIKRNPDIREDDKKELLGINEDIQLGLVHFNISKQGLGNVFKKIGQKFKKMAEKSKQTFDKGISKIRTFAKRQAQNVKDFVKDPKKTIKKIARGLAKVFPATLVGRNAFLGIVRLNVFKLAEKLRWFTLTDDEIKELNLSNEKIEKIKRGKEKLTNIWLDLGGEPKSLFDAIRKGSRKKGAFKKLNGLSGIGEYDPTTDDLGGIFGMIAMGDILYTGRDLYAYPHKNDYYDVLQPKYKKGIDYTYKGSTTPSQPSNEFLYTGKDLYGGTLQNVYSVFQTPPLLTSQEWDALSSIEDESIGLIASLAMDVTPYLVNGISGLGLEPATTTLIATASGVTTAILAAVGPILKSLGKDKEGDAVESAAEVSNAVNQAVDSQEKQEKDDDDAEEMDGLLGKRRKKRSKKTAGMKKEKKSRGKKEKKQRRRGKSKSSENNDGDDDVRVEKRKKRKERAKKILDKFEDSTGIKFPFRKRNSSDETEALTPAEQGYQTSFERNISQASFSDREGLKEKIIKFAPIVIAGGALAYTIVKNNKK